MNEHWNFSEAAFSIARSISKIKRLRRDFAPFSDCLKQAKNLMFKESMKEIDQLISQGHLTGYDVKPRMVSIDPFTILLEGLARSP